MVASATSQPEDVDVDEILFRPTRQEYSPLEQKRSIEEIRVRSIGRGRPARNDRFGPGRDVYKSCA
jgi:hypothetical protein